ncbi:MAG: carbamate kinase [Candidatus Thalassarchaeaceae archaeon]|jgi:carbamate kinase|nr:carbamate kinase [Candidatus Thalassarchaeaceae archaeon]|tara:strand:+ start:1313 stop:2221 length:909 start_codon:yes stop_codon:yes gene_type:complete
MRIVIALGGNALLRRGEAMTAENQRNNIQIATKSLAPVVEQNELVISHGNGPQVGLLSLQSAAYKEVDEYPLDILGAQTQGMIGYMIEQELGNLLPIGVPIASILTMVEVDPEDPAFLNPTKPIGPIYTQKEAEKLRNEKNWEIKRDGKHWRRVVPSPIPHRIFELRPIHWLLEKGTVVICAGGGGIPTIYNKKGELEGVEVVIDKDRASSLLAFELDADLLILATDTDGVYLDWGTESEKIIIKTTPDEIRNYEFDEGSMGPKVEAACSFVERSGQRAVIGSLKDIEGMVNGTTGTQFVLK